MLSNGNQNEKKDIKRAKKTWLTKALSRWDITSWTFHRVTLAAIQEGRMEKGINILQYG